MTYGFGINGSSQKPKAAAVKARAMDFSGSPVKRQASEDLHEAKRQATEVNLVNDKPADSLPVLGTDGAKTDDTEAVVKEELTVKSEPEEEVKQESTSDVVEDPVDESVRTIAAEAPVYDDPVPSEEENKYQDHAIVVPARAPQLQFLGKKTGLAYDVRMRYHSRPIADPISYIDPHPEDPRRTFRIYRAIAEAGLITDETLQGSEKLGPLMKKLPTREATEEELRLVHTQQMIDFIKSTAGMQLEDLQRETDRGDSIYLNNDSNQAARLSAGGAIEACKGVVEGSVKNAIAVIRPPGHHAEPGNPAGFCLFANVAIASEVMLKNYPSQVRKILIYDWDVHHGNGTQRAFLEDDRVLYISTHRYDNGTFYPGTRFAGADVVGVNKGAGYSVNIPWKCGGMGDGDYLTAFNRIIMPIASEFDPDLVIVSAGFDAADGDPIGGCHLSPEGYQHMLAHLMTLAEGKVVVCLEGGYNLDSISRSALAITKTLLGDPPGRPTGTLASDAALEVFAEVRAIQSQFWKSMGPPTIKFEPEIEAYNRQQQQLTEKAEHLREEDEKEDSNSVSSGISGSTTAGLGANIGSTNTSGEDTKLPDLRSLMDLVRGNEASQLTNVHSFAKLPLLRSGPIDSEIMSTPDIYNKEHVVLLFHGMSLIWAHSDPITGRIRPDESVVANPCAKYIEWAIGKGYGVVDVFVTPLESTSPAKLVATICENAVRFFKSKQISVVGVGQAYGYAVQTAAHRCLKDRLSAIVCFVGPEDTLRQFPSSSDDAAIRKFHDKSLVFTVKNHNTWKQKYTRKKCGRLIRCESENLYALMNERFGEATEWIEAAEEEDEDEDEE